MSDVFRLQQEVGCALTGLCGGDDIPGELSEMLWAARSHHQSHPDNVTSNGGPAPNNNIEADLAKEMNQLSVQEREQVYDELHGVAKTREETPDFHRKCISDFDRALSLVFKHKRKALDRAIFLKPSIQTDTELKLLFLRSEYFNAAKAANRMARFFERKLLLFGEEKLAKDITRDDLDDDEIRYGAQAFGLLPLKDRSGRSIHISFLDKFDFTAPVEKVLRGTWYHMMAFLQDDKVASKQGLCQLIYTQGPIVGADILARISYVVMKGGDALLNDLPIRYTSYHYCYNNPTTKLILSAVHQSLGKQIRLRLRTHYGSPLEIQYSLLTFGLDCGAVLGACQEGDEWPMEVLDAAFFERRREAERKKEQLRIAQESATGIILHPNSNDVLVGRGHFFASHCGNRQYHHLVDSKLELYNQSNNRFWKTTVALDVVKTVQESNGRFLTPIKGGWKVINDTTAREKTSILFRSRFKKQRLES